MSGRYSPTSSIMSIGPDIPTAPESPWMSDFYDSEVETDNSRRSTSREVASRNTTLERPRTASNTRQPPSPSAANYMQYRSRNILDRAPYHWPTSAPSTLERPGSVGRRSNTVPRDLFDITRRRRGGSGTDDTDRLEDWIDSLLSQSTRPTSTTVTTQASPVRSKAITQHVAIDTGFPRSVLLIVVKCLTHRMSCQNLLQRP